MTSTTIEHVVHLTVDEMLSISGVLSYAREKSGDEWDRGDGHVTALQKIDEAIADATMPPWARSLRDDLAAQVLNGEITQEAAGEQLADAIKEDRDGFGRELIRQFVAREFTAAVLFGELLDGTAVTEAAEA